MGNEEPSGQQAVEPWQIVRASMVEQAGDDNPSRVARNILHALRNAGFTVSRTAAPTAPSTAAGEPALVCGCGWEGSYADLNETAEGMTCPKCRLSRNMDCAATPPAQGVEPASCERCQGNGEIVTDWGRYRRPKEDDVGDEAVAECPDCDGQGFVSTPPADVPWQEQAARQCEEWALLLSAKGSNAAKVFDRIQFNADAVKLRDHARAFRALLSKPAKGEGN